MTINIHQRPALIFDGTNFHLEKTDILDARQIFVQWYKTQARKVISERIALISKKNDLIYHKVRISSARTRWGSCSSNGTLSFIWRLVLAPPEIIDYVVVHELVHTQIKNHSAKFWRRVADIMPEYKRHVTWLKENGRFLTLGEDH